MCFLYYSAPPVITSPPVNITNVSREATITFHCGSQGSPPPDVTWTVDNQDVIVVSCAVCVHGT